LLGRLALGAIPGQDERSFSAKLAQFAGPIFSEGDIELTMRSNGGFSGPNESSVVPGLDDAG